MKETRTLKRLRKQLENCPEVAEIKINREAKKSHVPNVVEVWVSLKAKEESGLHERPCHERIFGEYKRYYEPISEVWFTKVGKWNVVFIVA